MHEMSRNKISQLSKIELDTSSRLEERVKRPISISNKKVEFCMKIASKAKALTQRL